MTPAGPQQTRHAPGGRRVATPGPLLTSLAGQQPTASPRRGLHAETLVPPPDCLAPPGPAGAPAGTVPAGPGAAGRCPDLVLVLRQIRGACPGCQEAPWHRGRR